ncbi:MAG: PadR family transcriptional regulator [Streptosporangiaceae bacterium]|jgi:PadR family transcriptional regulator AphA|nr:PadR family transcriptional regulator [Actinomycetota bacterium]
MNAPAEPSLSLAEWLVLCLICEEPAHGFALARLLGTSGSIGQVWRVPKPVVYRALQRLEQLGLVRTTHQQSSSQGPVRSLVDATPAGRELASAWLSRPASKNRDVRSELLVKLALLDRAGADPGPLLDAQRDRLIPVAAALQDRLAEAASFDRTLILWRYETLSATLRFLEALRSEALAAAPAS